MVVERYNEAALLSRLGEKRAASSTLARAIDLASGMNPEKRVPTYVTLLAGELAGDLGRPDSAVATFRRALAETKAGGDTAYQVRALSGLSGVLIDRRELREARKYLDELRSVVPEKLRWRAEGLEAGLLYAQGNKSEGRRQYLALLTTARIIPEHSRRVSCSASAFVQRVMQQEPRLPPVPLHRPLRDTSELRDLHEREATEEVQVDQLGKCRIQVGQLA